MTKEENKKKPSQKPSKKAEKKSDELLDDLKRLQADFINYKRRAEEEKLSSIQFGKQTTIAALLPLVDDIERALAHQPDELKENSWAQGVAQVAKRIEASLKSMGVEKVGAVGEAFDPELHEAIGFEDGEGEEVIGEVMQAGYVMGNQTIRPAMVKVIKESKKEK